ncbi:Cryptochrome DASH (Protein CRY-DASH) (zCRY-DASH) [Durusdinium trenchii]|uniref:Cryptochrome DASH (Protein CRY-DASH) (ZCRY-DASH) n=1 Tax=Durusdinium trenchii TaxID=1381693 RepID=A0ABP0IBQ1_9DINO
MAGSKPVVLWFRSNLRLRDNAMLHLKEVQQASAVAAVCVLDQRFENKFTLPFKRQALDDLRHSLKEALGVPLLCFNGKAEEVLPRLVELVDSASGGTIVSCQEVCSWEKAVEKRILGKVSPRNWALKTAWDYSLYHPEDLPFTLDKVPEPFTAARNAIEERKTRVRAPLGVPAWGGKPSLGLCSRAEAFPEFLPAPDAWEPPTTFRADSKGDDNKGLRFRGGEHAALLRLEDFIAHGLRSYKGTRNNSVGWQYSTKLSPWLAAGNISPRQVHHRIRKYEDEFGETKDTYWVTFELMWRDFNRFLAVKHGNKIFHQLGPADRLPKGVFWLSEHDPASSERLQAWKDGRTGIPWVDGHMRELLSTGFMSNRGRQNVASFLVHNLKVDWRQGASHFQDLLIDHDVTANWCNWMAAAGVGQRGARVNRFNMVKQAADYDPEAEHAKLWIPEIAGLQAAEIRQLALGERRVANYPSPVVPLRSHQPSKQGAGRHLAAQQQVEADCTQYVTQNACEVSGADTDECYWQTQFVPNDCRKIPVAGQLNVCVCSLGVDQCGTDIEGANNQIGGDGGCEPKRFCVPNGGAPAGCSVAFAPLGVDAACITDGGWTGFFGTSGPQQVACVPTDYCEPVTASPTPTWDRGDLNAQCVRNSVEQPIVTPAPTPVPGTEAPVEATNPPETGGDDEPVLSTEVIAAIASVGIALTVGGACFMWCSRSKDAEELKVFDAEKIYEEELQRAHVPASVLVRPVEYMHQEQRTQLNLDLIVSFAFVGESEDELTVEPGMMLTALQRISEDWWEAQTKDGQIGLVPASYVTEAKKKDPLAAPPTEFYIPEDEADPDF